MGYADLHIHSQYSDGTFTPEEIVRFARRNNATLISVCDHDVIEGTLETAKLAAQAGIGYIPGAEVDAAQGETNVHVLCYRADFENAGLAAVMAQGRRALDRMSDVLLERMIRDYPTLSAAEYGAMEHDPRVGGWKMLEYLVKKNIVPAVRDGFSFYARYGVGYGDAGFNTITEVVEAIHGAGGMAILAHPMVTFPTDSIRQLKSTVCELMEMGFDGVECDHPGMPRGVWPHLREMCDEHGWRITGGSDTHGAFNHREVACNGTLEQDIRL